MIIQAFNPDISQYETTNLTVPTTIGATALPVQNANMFAENDILLIGAMGREKSELSTVSGVPTSINIPTDTLEFPHSTDDPVYKMRFDQVKFYRSTTGIDGTYSLLNTEDIDVDNADESTYYDDISGLSTYFYKTSFYNSATSIESLQSDPIPGTGYDPGSAGAIIDATMREVGDPEGTTATREEYYSWLNEVNYDLQKRMRKPYDFLKKDKTVDVTAGNSVPYPDDVLHFDTVEYTYNLGGYNQIYNPIPIYYDEWIRLNTVPTYQLPNDQIEKIYFDDVNKVVETFPKFATSQTGTWIFHYWKKFNYIQSDGDLTETIDPKIYKMYLKAQYFRKKAAREERFTAISDRWFSDYNVELANVGKYDRKNVGKPQSFRMERRPSLRYYRGFRYR